jgi:hypothetical protein
MNQLMMMMIDDDNERMKKILIYCMKGINYDKPSVMKLTKMLKDLAEENKSLLSVKALVTMSQKLKYMNRDVKNVPKMNRMLEDVAEEKHKDPMSVKALGRMFHNLKVISSNSPEALEMLKLMVVLSKCNEALSAQDVGNIMFGKNGMRSDKPKVLELLKMLSGPVKTCV